VPEIVFAVLGGIVAVATAVFVRPWLTERRTQGRSMHQVVGGAATLLNRNTVLLVGMTVIGGLVDFGFLGMYGTFMQTALHYSPVESGVVMGISGAGALLSFYGGHLGDRHSPRTVLPASFAVTGVAGAALFLGPGNVMWQAVFALLFGIAFSAGAFVMLAGFLVKSVDGRRAGITSGIFVTSIYIPAAFAGVLFSWLAQSWSWAAAALIQIVLGSAVATALALLLQPSRFSTVLPAQESAVPSA
jgi:MFS family permease